MEDLVEVTNDSSAIYAMWGLFFIFLPVILIFMNIFSGLGTVFFVFLGLYFLKQAKNTKTNPEKKKRDVGFVIITGIIKAITYLILLSFVFLLVIFNNDPSGFGE